MKKPRYIYSIPGSSQFIVKLSVIIVLAISILDLAGWMFNITFLRSLNLEWTPMKVITAFCFIFSGAAMVFIQISSQTRLQIFLTKVLSIVISTIGLLTVVVYISVLTTGSAFPYVDSMFFSFFLAPATRMALVSASLFFIIGIVLFFLSFGNQKGANIAHALILPVSIISYMVMISYILRVHNLHSFQNISVALNSGISFLALCFAVLFSRTDTWFMKVFTSENDGGRMARMLMPVLMVLPVVIGWFRIFGEQMHFYESDVGVLIVAVTYVICFLWLVWFTAKSVNRSDYKRNYELKLAAEEWQTTFDSISDAVSIQDKDFRLVRVNKSYEKAVGLTNEELIGKRCFEIVHKTKCPRIGCPHAITIESGKSADVETYEPDTGIYIEESTSPILNKNGEVIGSVHISKDITSRKQAERLLRENEQKLKYHFENSPLAVVEWDNNFVVTNWTKEAERIFGWKSQEIIGKRIDSINMIYEEDIPVVNNTMERLTSGIENTVVSLNRNYTKSGNIIFCTWYNSILFDEKGEMSSVMSLIDDITERKLSEEKLKEAKEVAEEAVKAKQQFLSNMSHEIRTPMTAIIGFAKVILKTDLSEKQREYMTAIKLSGDTLLVLINDILDLAKVDSGKMTFEQTPFKMKSSISAILHLFDIKLQEKNLELVKEYDDNIPEVLVGDQVRLHQILLNLMSNAVKFTSSGKITVSVRLLNEDDGIATIEFSVSDTGVGIAENKIKHIFETFRQASSSTARLYGGTGLGLAIVKKLVKLQGGTINVKSKIDEGSTFSIILGFQKTKVEAKSEDGIFELYPEAKTIKVLVVEDVPLNQLLMKTILNDFGFDYDIASNGLIAIEKLLAKSYDIILMDLQMPEMNGFEATEYIRKTMNNQIPIIALTADVTTVDLEKCKTISINDYIAKPIDERELHRKIVGLVKNHNYSPID
jgi:PAS domain S-box-containing protein